MFLPIGVDPRPERTPFVTYTLILINVLVFVLFNLGTYNDPGAIRWALVPADLHWPALFTSLFLHASWAHLLGNMLFLWIFGSNVEDRLNHAGYVLFYFLGGLAAGGAHILSDPLSTLPTLGASGAISAVMGAYIVFYPRYSVKTFIWLGIWYVDVVRTPAFLWIGIWFVQQILLNLLTRGGSGVAYLAHIGGFIAGAAMAGVLRGLAGARRSGEPAPLESPAGHRRPFLPVPEVPEIEWVDEPGDSYSVLRLDEDPAVVGTISDIVGSVTGEASADVAERLRITRGMIARQIPRDAAEKIQRDLQERGIASAKILHNRANLPPPATPVEGVSWDVRNIRFRSGEQIVQIPWASSFLWVGARSEGKVFIDVFINRKTAFRVADSRATLLTEVDPSGRSEVARGFPAFAAAARSSATASALNEGITLAAEQAAWGRLDFPRDADYDDYVFWLYNLILARAPHLRG